MRELLGLQVMGVVNFRARWSKIHCSTPQLLYKLVTINNLFPDLFRALSSRVLLSQALPSLFIFWFWLLCRVHWRSWSRTWTTEDGGQERIWRIGTKQRGPQQLKWCETRARFSITERNRSTQTARFYWSIDFHICSLSKRASRKHNSRNVNTAVRAREQDKWADGWNWSF